MDELLGRATGVCGGRAGSMNVIDPEHGLLGCYGIVGGSIAAATGAALALRGTGNVAVAFFGDGAVNQAYFYECLNFAKVFSLPALYVCENNVYGEYTPLGGRDRGHREEPRGGDGAAGAVHRRQRPVGGPGGGRSGARGRPGRAGAGVHRSVHLPLRRPLAQRPGEVPSRGRARHAGASATRSSSRGRG